MRIEELNLTNLNMLPLGPRTRTSHKSGNNSTRNSQRVPSQEMQLMDYIQASKAQAQVQMRKKKGTNIFTRNGGINTGQDGTENWLLSDMGSDNVSMGGDSNASHTSLHRPKFQA